MRDVYHVLQSFGLHPAADCLFPLGNAGGMSGAVIWRVATPETPKCLRRWPTPHPARDQLCWIHQQMRRARSAGCQFVPELTEATADGSTIVEHAGRLWELSTWQPGRADYHQNACPARLIAALQALARFHQSVVNSSDDRWAQSPGLEARWRQLEQLRPSQIDDLRSHIDGRHGPELAQLARSILHSVPRGMDRARATCRLPRNLVTPLQPCLRDVWHDHLLFTGDQVSGLVDFGAMRMDTPVTDIARLLGSLARTSTEAWNIGLQAYQERRPLAQQEWQLLAAFDAANIVLSGLNWIRWLYVEQRRFESLDKVQSRMQEIAIRVEQFAENAWPFDGQL